MQNGSNVVPSEVFRTWVVGAIPEKIAATDIILPRADTHPFSQGRPAKDSRVSILLVDDDDAFRETVAEGLEDLGYAVVAVATAQSAYDAVLTRSDIDIVISDVVMPDIDGVTLAGMLRSFNPKLPIVFITGDPRDFVLTGEMVLAKPLTFADLVLLIGQGLRQVVNTDNNVVPKPYPARLLTGGAKVKG